MGLGDALRTEFHCPKEETGGQAVMPRWHWNSGVGSSTELVGLRGSAAVGRGDLVLQVDQHQSRRHWHLGPGRGASIGLPRRAFGPGHGDGVDYGSAESPGPQAGQLIPGLLWLAALLMQQNE